LMDALSRTTGISASSVRERLRAMEAKGCLKIVRRDRGGTYVRVLLPCEIPAAQRPAQAQEPPNIEDYDFYSTVNGRAAIFRREGGRCFYCLRRLSSAATVFDHACAQANGLNNSYRNVVACC